MAEELQALLDRINEQGIEKAEQERRERLEDAKKEAERLIDEAKSRAEQIVAEARKEAGLLNKKGQDALRQAARDTILSLRERLQEQVSDLAEKAISEDLNPESLAAFISKMIDAQGDEPDGDIEVQVPRDSAEAVRKHLLAKLGKNLKEKVEISPRPEISGGFRLSIKKGEVYYDFSEAALADILCSFLNPKLAEIVKPALTGNYQGNDSGAAKSADASSKSNG